MTPSEFAIASMGAGATVIGSLLAQVDVDSGAVVSVTGLAMWGATMVKSWWDHRERMVKFERDVKDLRFELSRISKLARQLAEVLKIDREWMARVAAKTGEPLPEGFGKREFDQPSTDIHPAIVMADVDSDEDPHPIGPVS